MRPRQQIIELFSTFLQFEADRFDRWVTDVRLQRQMQQYLQQASEPTSERFWLLYWYKHWQTAMEAVSSAETRRETRAELHLAAYLQEACYWAAYQTMRKFTDSQYRLSDCFQLAIAEVPAILKGFNPERGASLKTYAGMAFTSLLRDTLRQRQVIDLCTDWSLLRRVSKKRLLEALQAAGVSQTTMEQYRLAWTCFKTLYVPNAPNEKLTKPEPSFWESMAKLYNAERQSQLVTPGSAITAATLERWIMQMANWVRSYLYPAIGSLNTPQFGDDSTELQDTLGVKDSLLNELIVQEEIDTRATQQAQLNQTLSTAITKLDPQAQNILQLYYQQGMTQQQIMREMAMSQASVSRRLSKSRETLLTAIVQWCQTMNILPTPALIKEMSTALDEWLNAYYQANGAALPAQT